jgi:hypothetical protein
LVTRRVGGRLVVATTFASLRHTARRRDVLEAEAETGKGPRLVAMGLWVRLGVVVSDHARNEEEEEVGW